MLFNYVYKQLNNYFMQWSKTFFLKSSSLNIERCEKSAECLRGNDKNEKYLGHYLFILFPLLVVKV